MTVAPALFRLTRLDSSILGFLTIFLPVFVRTGDAVAGLRLATPLLFIYMSAFVVNDIDDLERDRTNHPDRPLQAAHLNPRVAVAVFFICLGGALFSTRAFVTSDLAFWYYAMIVLAISYSYVVEWLPAFKAPYVAASTSIPVFVVANLFRADQRLLSVGYSMFLIMLGRELCMDIHDRPGDPVSFVSRIPALEAALAAFGLQAAGLAVLGFQFHERNLLPLVLMATILTASSISWFVLARQGISIRLMKGQFAVGLWLLV